ncbi:MAG: ChbG/HpnK family deacetylase [Nitrospirae bacterium]|nr:ChbG/HpnK family deacetylase [Nitrospirota bacterium]
MNIDILLSEKKRQIKVILCADDFGIAPGVSSAIIDLINQKKITAASCMSISKFWHEHSQHLLPFRRNIDAGLHFTLTGFHPLGEMPILAPNGYLPKYRDLLKRALIGVLDLKEIKDEMIRQLNAFEIAWGSLPDFLDGHMFVHQLPGIREVLIDIYRSRLQGSGAYIRVYSTPISVIFHRRVNVLKPLSIGYFGWQLQRLAGNHKIPVNSGFSGIYDFSCKVPYKKLFEKFLIGIEDRSQIMCHPGIVDDELIKLDDLTRQREAEYIFFLSNDFLETLKNAGVKLGRFY